ncbi:MAG: S8 family serine peptidase, partial [Oscillospiraceae bacterium]|nr:S8 family serine peptidase [Oscillospiraceae bacterium]
MGTSKIDKYIEFLEWIASRYDLPGEWSDTAVDDFVSEMGSLPSIWGISGRDVSGADFSKVSDESFFKLAFNEYTKFPENFKFDCKRMMEEAKEPGLGIAKLHEKGIEGRGINVAVIDKPILETHGELAGRLKSYTFIAPENEFNDCMHFHGITCAAFLCGNSCGIANGANLHYYAYPDKFEDDGMYWGYHFKALDMIIEHNQNATPEDAIKIVSISAGFGRDRVDLSDKMSEYVIGLKEMGCYVVFSNLFGETFSCSSKASCFDNDNPDNYKFDLWQNEWCKNKIIVPAGGRTSPCNSGDDKYMYNGNQSCYSWAIPYLCGVFALALQADKTLGYEDFCEKAKKTAIVNKEGLSIINPVGIVMDCVIKQKIREIEICENIHILHAVESGSRAW